MDINKADYWTTIKFGNLELFLEKLKIEKKRVEEVVNFIDKNGISLLEKSLISRKFDIANFLLDNNAKIN
ncbi:MAG: ankyrin repeat domain-containing protein, partial [Psychrobacillus psychrotolerans]